MILSNLLNTSLNIFLSETNIKDVLQAISETYCGRMMSYKQVNFTKTDNALFKIYMYVLKGLRKNEKQ